jgi:hypothetical protein
LRLSCPDGIYLSLTPNNPQHWSGIIFVRGGPYGSLIARFGVTFPDSYPAIPPTIIFHTEIFHPLIVPLTTYTYSTGVDSSGTVSANDDERLPPGAFSLRDAFPAWFGEGRRRSRLSQDISNDAFARSISPIGDVLGSGFASPNLRAQKEGESTDGSTVQPQLTPSVQQILGYLKSTFENPTVLDNLSLESCGNPGAWHAWRAYRGLPKYTSKSRPTSPVGSPNRVLKHPGEWNWEGVWESRVSSQVQMSASESVLFGSGSKNELIRFADLDEEKLQQFRDEMLRNRRG